ncbi:hypothetical protein ACFWCR_28040 [Streptomyces goshikiensis]|uniref:hypothetical protein n=1 Tax=Streptomyces goshikiensis TaxID=1942 RepID=UPI00367F5FD2
MKLAYVIQTLPACPSQWNAWTDEGKYLYLRYRCGVGTVDAYSSQCPGEWDRPPSGSTARFEDPDDPMRGEIDLAEFCERAGLTLATDATVVPFRWAPDQA